jgi:type VI secretion system protein ImpG
MRDELLTYYERELSYLRRLGVEFAAKYPKVAGRLGLEAEGSQDPHVERLLEGVAFLTARVRRKIDDDLPEVSASLLGILYPHYLAPVPSMAVVQFHLDPDQGKLTSGYEVPRDTVLTTRPVHGVRCRYRTAFPVHLWPLELVDAALEHPLATAPAAAARDFRARSLVRLRFRLLPEASFAAVRPARLRVHLHGESALTAGLYEMLSAGPCQTELHAPGGTRPPLVLPPDAITPAGFAPDETMLPVPRHSFPGYALLEEYFCFPQKFLFLDLAGLDRAAAVGADREVELRIFSARAPRFDQAVQPTTFRLGCTPVANLFPKLAEPIQVDHTRHEYLVVPDVHGPEAHEVYAVESVVGVGGDGPSPQAYRPFYALRHGSDLDAPDLFWHAVRREALDGATDVWLSLLDGRLRPSSPPVETLSLQITCTNRDLPAQLAFSGTVGGDLDSEHVAPFVRVQCLNKPTPARRREVGRGAHWRLVSHLALNYLSLVEGGREALQGILELYDAADTAATRRQIAGIRDVRSARVVRNVGGAFCRGLRVTIDFDREHFVGTSPILLATVLDRFLGLYAALNSFTQLVARTPPDEEPLHAWPARAGAQILL